jgi:hypothetical protein
MKIYVIIALFAIAHASPVKRIKATFYASKASCPEKDTVAFKRNTGNHYGIEKDIVNILDDSLLDSSDFNSHDSGADVFDKDILTEIDKVVPGLHAEETAPFNIYADDFYGAINNEWINNTVIYQSASYRIQHVRSSYF